MTEQPEQLEPHEQRLRDLGLPTLAETRKYRETVGWVPYEDYMKKILHHHPGRKFDDFNMSQDWFDKQIEPNRLLRETAYLLGLKHRPLDVYTEDDQKELEEEIYNRFMLAMFEGIDHNYTSDPWPVEEN